MDVQKRRKKEQEKQKRERLVQSKAVSFPSQVHSSTVTPCFGSLKLSDGQSDELARMTKTILGPYDACKEAMQSMNHNQQQQLLGTFEATPSTPLHPVTGNPFDKQFAKSLDASALTGTTSFATKAITSAASSSVAQCRAELNRHSVAEAPNSTREDKAGKSRGPHSRNDHGGSAMKMSKQPSDSQFSMPKPIHKKSFKSREEVSSDVSSRPTNMLVVKKPKEKSRVRPVRTVSSPTPTGNQQGLTLTKKSAGSSQGAGDLFKVDSEHGTVVRSAPSDNNPTHTRAPTPPVPLKRPPKLKKRHSHRLSATSPTTDSQTTASSSSMRKSNSVHSHSHLSSSSSTPLTSSTPHRHRKQSSSTASTPHSSHSSLPPSHLPSSSLTTKKQGNSSSQSSQNPAPASSDKNRVRASGGGVTKVESTSEKSSVAIMSLSSVTGGGSSATAGVLAEKLAKKKRKKARRERERTQESEKERTKQKTEPSDSISEPIQHPQSSATYVPLLNQQQAILLSNPPLTSHDQTAGVVGSKVKLERLSKQRPSNLSIDTYGENMEENTLDIGDIQNLLKELVYNVEGLPPITPLLTPKKNTPFVYPLTSWPLKTESIPEAPPIGPAHPVSDSDSDSSGSSSGSSSDSSDCDDDNEQGQERKEGRLGGRIRTSLSLEEGETPGWENIVHSVGDSITPLKKTPPYPATTPQLSSFIHLPSTVISPLSADTPVQKTNPSPHHSAASVGSKCSVSSFGSFPGLGGFVLGTSLQPQTVTASTSSNDLSSSFLGGLGSGQPIYSQTATTVDAQTHTEVSSGVTHLPHPPTVPRQDAVTHEEEMASSSESEDESGSESDDELSDSDEHSSAEEEEGANKTTLQHPPPRFAPKPSTGSSASSAPFFSGDDGFFFQGENSGGFFNDDDFISRLQGGGDRQGDSDAASQSRNPLSESHWFNQSQVFQPVADEMRSGGGTNVCVSGQPSEGGDGVLELQRMAVPPSQQEQPTAFASVPTSSEILSGTPVLPSVVTSVTDLNARTQPDSLAPPSTGTPTPVSTSRSFILTHQHSLDDSSRGKKRRLERQASLTRDPSSVKLQPPAQKTPRTCTNTVRRRDSSLSSFFISSDSSSDSSGSSDEQSETEHSPASQQHYPTDPAPPSVATPAPRLPSVSSVPSLLPPSTSSVTSSIPPPSTPHVTVVQKAPLVHRSSSSQLEAGELEDEGEEVGGKWEGVVGGEVENFLVKIPLEKVNLKEQKPKAKVEPYNVTAPSRPPRRRSTIDSSSHEELSRLPGHHGDHDDARSIYSRPREREDDHHGQYSRTDFLRDDGRRSHRGSGWESGRERDSWSSGRHGPRVNRSRDRDRDRDHHRPREWDDYGLYDDSRSRSRGHPSTRNMSADDCLREARKRKHDADKTRAPGIEKAKAYLESVVYFMRHGDAIEREAQSWDGAQTKNPFRLYMDTITMMKYCQSWAQDCKQLVALCMRCVSVLYWKLFLLKQTTAANIQKDLQDFFLPSKGTQKSPYLSSLSPIPSPASVGSTASTGSGGGGVSALGSTQDPSPSSHVTVPKPIFIKAADHLTITSYLHQSMDLWRQSNLIVEQYREFFSNLDSRRSGRITQFSPISDVADWLECGARMIRYRS